ncbi:hypothetical protein D3C72_1588740 [compost metagenome]
MFRWRSYRKSKRIAISICSSNGSVHRIILVCGNSWCRNNRSNVCWINCYWYSYRNCTTFTIAYRYRKAISTAVIISRCISIGTIGIHHNSSVCRLRSYGEGKRIAIYIAGGNGSVNRCIFIGNNSWCGCNRRIVYRRYSHRNSNCGCTTFAIAYSYDKYICTIIIWCWRIDIGTIRVYHYRTVCRRCSYRKSKRIVISIGSSYASIHSTILVGA